MSLAIRLAFATIAFAICAAPPGCGGKTDKTEKTGKTGGKKPAGHAHPDKGPHNGSLIELGDEEYHGEFVHDESAGSVTIYILDDGATRQVPIDAKEVTINVRHGGTPAQFKLPASPDETDPAGKSSRFVSTDKKLGDLLDKKDAEARLIVKIDGKSFNGKISHGHSHAGDDALVWRRENIEHQGFRISLGHHGKHLHAGKSVDPAVMILRDGKPVAAAQVFNSLVSADGKTVIAKEVATTYEPTTAEEPAHYAQGELQIPAGVDRVILRFRIVLPDGGGESTLDAPVPVEK